MYEVTEDGKTRLFDSFFFIYIELNMDKYENETNEHSLKCCTSDEVWVNVTFWNVELFCVEY